MDKQQLSEQQEKEIKDANERGAAFEELVRHPGWALVRAYYENKVKSFANGILLMDNEAIEKFEGERREIIGIRKLLGHVDESIRQFEQRQKA